MNWNRYHPPAEVAELLTHCQRLTIGNTTHELVDLASGGAGSNYYEVAYDVLLGLGEREGWVTNHCSTVQVGTPYDNVVAIMHEGASGGGKSEMLEQAHREPDGRLLLGENVVTGERRHLEIPRGRELRAVTDDMALCHPSLQDGNGKLVLTDDENAWFVRVNHPEHYGTDVHLKKYLARRGAAKFRPDQLGPARCPLPAHTLHQLQVEGRMIARWFLRVDTKPEMGIEADDQGAEILRSFFRTCLADSCVPDLDPLGKRIIECCVDGGRIEDYEQVIPTR